MMTRIRSSLAVLTAIVCLGGSAYAGDIDHKDLLIAGLSLEVDTTTVVANAGIPAAVQTKFGGRINDDAPPDNGMTAIGDLTGPGIDTPIRLVTKPGHLFRLPVLNEKGDYVLRNIRLVSADGNVLQTAVPSFANITITQVLDTKLSVHQLTPDELRARGITVDAKNYDVYEYTFLFAVNGQTVTVPYSVIIDKRTHEVINAPAVDPYNMPAPQHTQPPRFQAPFTKPFSFSFDGNPPGQQSPEGKEPRRIIPAIPAALVIPTGLGVLHQFFAVILNVGNSAPAGSSITVDSITATLDAPLGLRLAKTTPAVTIGQAVPITDSQTGARFLVAAAQGSAEWSLEALKTGTHTVAVHVRATYKAPNQPDTPIKGDLSASFVVSDPRFQVNFVHPRTIRSGEDYTAYAFITNTSAVAQTIRLDVGQIPVCGGDTSWSNFNVCFPQAMDPVEATIERGKTLTVPYHLKSRLTGSIFASAGQADDNIKVGVSLSMGVSASGIPLSPATLLMPWYTRYLDQEFVSGQLTLFGLGYSLAVAPLTERTALLPRVIPDDVFRRAQDVARAGERIFIQRAAADVAEPAAEREPLFDLSLDLLSNVEQIDRLLFTPDLKEWDELRRSEDSGRTAAAAMTRQLERVGLTAGKSATDFANDFAAATAHRSPYALAIVHGASVSGSARPYAMTVTGRTSHGVLAVPSEASKPWTRSLPFGELTQIRIPNEYGELAMIGRFSESIQIDVVPASSDFSVDLIYPAAADGSVMRASFRVTNASTNGVSFVIDRGLTNIIVAGGTYVPVSGPSAIAPPPLAISGAAQDMHLNDEGRTVSLLLNRPITVADPAAVRDLIALTTDVSAIGYHARRRNTASRIYMPGAALQDDGRTLNVYFDKTLSKNAAYTIDLDASLVPGGGVRSTAHPRIDNDTPSGLLYGKVLRGDNTPIVDAPVSLQTKNLAQFDRSLDGGVTGTTDDSGRYLFEYIPRDDNHSLPGTFTVKAQTAAALLVSDGIIRSPGELRHLDLVFLGRGTVTGFATYSDGRPLAHATVVAGSAGYNNPMMSEMKSGATGADGAFTIGDLPVGPFTLSVSDDAGNISYAANQIHSPGEVLRQDLVVRLRPFPGTGTVRVTVRRSDVAASDPHSLVAGAHVGVFSDGFGLVDGFTDADGRVDFNKIPAGPISVLAANFDLARESVRVEADLHGDSTLDEVLTLDVPNAADLAARATLTGTIFRDDPFNPANVTPVPGAIVTVAGFASVTAGGDGKFTYEGIPLARAGKDDVRVFDPATGRQGYFSLPTPLVAGVNPVTFVLSSTKPNGYGTLRVRLFDAAGQRVSNYRVMIPGFPATPFTEILETPGIYELANVAVPRGDQVVAVPNGTDPLYGDQTATGNVRLDFNGQTSTVDMRLPGQGNVIAHLGCAPGVTNCNLDVHAPVLITYRVWNDFAQEMSPQDRRIDPGADGVLKITKVPVNQSATVATFDNPLGYASAPVELQFQGQQKDVFLTLTSTSTISGRVLNWDRQTPIFGALVHLDGGAANLGNFPTAADGSFRISGVAADSAIRVIAEYSIDGVFRTGSVDTHTPAHGGPVSNLVVILQEQASVDGTIVDGSGAPVPLARYWARELSWPYQTRGSFTAPLSADRNGHFVISNVFAGGIHISAQSPQFQEQRGEFEGTIAGEANNLSGVRIVVGAGGTGTITVTVYDGSARVANAEVTLKRGTDAFDFGQSDGNGIVNFDNVPVGGGYAVQVISRARARAGSSGTLTVTQSAVTSVDVGLSVLGVVSGTLVDGETNPQRLMAGGHITLSSGNVTLRTSTDAAGAYRFDGVPEGRFVISGFDFDSGRSTPSPPLELVLTSTIQELTNIKLTLEPTASLDVHVFLPNDTGGAGVAAPLVDVTVQQDDRYSREQQGPGSGLTFPKLFAKARFHVTATELGGESRTTKADGGFASGATSGTIALTFPASGTVQVTVASDDPNAAALIASSKVTIVTQTQGLVLFPDANGNITANGVQLGSVSATAVSQGLSASASGTLVSRSTPLHLTLMLGHRITMAGHVEAEAGVGQPAVHARVIAAVSSSAANAFTIETRTDASGNYSITGVPVGNTSVHFDFYGPDDASRGAQRTVSVPNGTVDSYPAPSVKLDATGPRVVSIDPPNNANSVAPNSPVTITFTEALDGATVNNGTFRVIASDDSHAAPVSITSEIIAGGQFRVRLTPTVLLKSNLTYTLSISDAITDPSGNKMTLPVTTNFTTVDYTEPRIVSTTPTIDQAIGDGTTFYLRFNKAIDGSVFASGGSAVLTLQQLDHNHGAPIGAPLPLSVFIDPKSASTLVVAPVGVALQAGSYYRITENGARDTLNPPNVQTTPQTFDFFSADHVKPVVTIDAPAAGTKLTAGVDYVATVSIVDEGTTPPHASNDIAYVQWFDATGKALTRATTAPYGYVLRNAAGVTTVTLKASAVDLSGNASDLAAQTWEVTANLPPQNIVITVPASAYIARTVALSATFEEDGLAVTSALAVTGKHRDGTPYALDAARIHRVSAQPIRRNTISDPWPAAQYTVDLPADLKEADALQFVLTLTDADNQPASKSASVDILADTNPPHITAMLPAGETRYKFGDPARNRYRAQISVTDPESGVAHVTFIVDGHTTDVNFGTSGSSYTNGIYTFFTDVDVAAKNVDTRIHITATAFDYVGNSSAQTTDVVYESVNDGTAPTGSWVTPLDGALVAKGNVTLMLRVHAVDDIHVDAVTFDSALFSSVTADRLANDVFEKSVTLATPADGSSFVVNATISDSGHQTVVPITIDQTVPDIDLATDSQINSGNAATFANKTVRIHGVGKKLYISVPVTLQNLIVADGAIAGNPDGTKIDLTVRDRLYVDGASAIDVTGKGFLGGWAAHESGGQNATPNGLTLGNAPGAAPAAAGSFFASGSSAGIGGADSGATTNATYGSITNPSDFGSGGSGAPTCTFTCAGGNGGGAVAITGGSGANDKSRFVIAGAIRADGQSGVNIAGAGSGGSINLHARALVAGWATRITANGGDDDGAPNASRGGGGGRIAAVISDRWDVEPAQPVLQARGGRNDSTTESRAYLEGGAGTVFVQKPGEANGELLVSSLDERHAASLHLTRATPLAGIVNFDSIAIGPRALARFDSDYTASHVTIDPTAVLLRPTDLPAVNLVSAPAAGTTLIQGSTLALTFNAQSNAGVGEIRATLAPAADLALPSFDYPPSIATSPANVIVPTNATPGAATLKLRVTDRAGRTAETQPVSYTIAADTAPVITQFDVAPASLQMYAGHLITVTAAASDDVEVKTLTLTSSAGTIAPVTPTPNPATHGLSATFVVTIPPATPAGTAVALTLTATDSRSLTAAQTKSVTILHDATPPAITMTAPSAGTLFIEGSSIAVSATIVDAEVGVKQAFASIDGVSVAMTQDAAHPSIWTATLSAPDVDGTADVPKTISVAASDFENNAATPATVSINVRPIVDALAPTVAWTCATPGAMYPAGAIARLQVLATPASGDSMNGVTMTITDTAGTRMVPMTSAGGGSYTYDYTLPTVTADTSVTLRAVASTIAGKSSSLPGSLIIIAPGPNVVTFAADATIAAADTTYEGKTIVVTAGTLTVTGQHTFNRLIVLGGFVVHAPADATTAPSLNIIATSTFVACGGAIEASARGYLAGRTYGNTTTGGPANLTAGSHGGVGGYEPGSGSPTAAYGSMYDPNEAGSGGAAWNTGALSGGGIIRLRSASIVLDGKINANGAGTTNNFVAGAGGSIRIDTNTISGAGEVHADGGAGFPAGGGGGRVAIYYVGASGQALTGPVTAAGGPSSANTSPQNGSPGTIYLRQLDAAGAKVSDELILDNGAGHPFGTATPLADLGIGTITAVNGNVLTLSNPVPASVAGTTIEILTSNGTVISSYEITASTATTVTVIVPSGQTLNAPVASPYRGSAKIAAITIRNGKLQTPALRGDDMTLKGEIDTTEVRGRNVTLKGASVRQTATTATVTNALLVVATGTLSVDAASVIDATGRGYLAGRTFGNTTTGGPVNVTAGSHGGVGGYEPGSGSPTAAYGSMYDPNEAGSGGAAWNTGALSGGGIIRLQSAAIVLDGKITASGTGTTNNFVAGAGGSIRIDTATISGAGEVHADGGAGFPAGGGGGRVAIYYVGASGQALTGPVTAVGGASSPNTSPQNGSPGTIYLRQLDTTGAKVTDELILDNATGRPFGSATPLVDLGIGTISAVNGNVLTLSNPVPASVAGTTIEILAANGTLLSSYEISASTATSVTVIVPNGQTLNAPLGSGYRGSANIVAITVKNGTLQTPALRGGDMTLKGEIDTTEIRGRNVTLKGASLRQTATTAAVTNALLVVATGTLSVDSASVIDATGRGYLAGRTFGNTTTGAPANAAAGSHGGIGGIDSGGLRAAAYGSLYDPNEPGSGGALFNTGALSGGGIIRLQSAAIVLDGRITASGAGTTNNFVAGAGGSIRIDTNTISGPGQVRADGGAAFAAGGGGGRVAIYYAGASGMTLSRALVTSVGGTSGAGFHGAAGTVYFKRNDQANGELVVDNGSIISSQTTPLTSVGGGFITSVSSSSGSAADTIGDSSAAFPIPNQLTGNRIYINGDKSVLWPTRSNTATAIALDISANALTAQTGQSYAGLYRFDTLRLRNAKLVSGDAIESLTAVDQDGASTITTNPFTPPSITAITASPGSVSSGGAITFAVRMKPRTQPTVVNLTSTNAAVPVPASITIAAGAQSAAFSVTTTSPASAVKATITASAGNTSASTTVTVIPAAAALASITLSPTTVVGGTSTNGTITLSTAAPAGGASVSLSSSNASLAIVPAVVVVPEGSASASFTVTTAQSGGSNSVTITGVYGSTQSAPLTITACSSMSAVTAPASAPLTTVWIDDALPAGATTSGSGGLTTAQAAGGTQSIGIPAASGSRQFAFTGGAPLAAGSNDKLVAYLLINPCNPPRQVMLAFSDGSNDYRVSWGEDLIETTTAHLRLGTMPAGGSWVRLEVLAASIGAAGKSITGLAIKVYDGEAWIDRIGTQICALTTAAPPSSFSPADTVWFDDQLPAGAIAVPSSWNFDTTQHASGANAHKEPLAAGEHEHSFSNAAQSINIQQGDVLVTWVLLDPCNPPREVMLEFNSGGSLEHRAIWGDDLISRGAIGTVSRYRAGPLPAAGGWVRLEVPAAMVGLESTTVTGMSFDLYDGQAWFDRAGTASRINLALSKTATQSSLYASDTAADKAVDGDTRGDFGKSQVAVTHQEAQAWWQVDLGATQPIQTVQLWNRTDCCGDRLANFWLFVSDAPFTSTDPNVTRTQFGVSSYRYDAGAGTNLTFLVNRTGRYVRVQLIGSEYLQLAEVQVWAPATSLMVNLAGGRSVTASSILPGYNSGPERAVNGNTDPDFFRELSVMHTSDTPPQSWFEVDLGSVQAISSADIWNRSDFHLEWTTNFYVFVSDVPFVSKNIAATMAQSGVSTFYWGSAASIGYSIPLNRTGRYVRVQLTGSPSQFLYMAEVQVWSQAASLGPLAQPAVPRTTSFDFRHAWRPPFAVVRGAGK